MSREAGRLSIGAQDVGRDADPGTQLDRPPAFPVPKPASNPTGPARNKDRISYAHQLFTIDLTQVTGGAQAAQSVTHELEIEFKDARVLLVEARKDSEGQENRYLEMVQAFLNNVREYCFLSMAGLSMWITVALLNGWFVARRDADPQRGRAVRLEVDARRGDRRSDETLDIVI